MNVPGVRVPEIKAQNCVCFDAAVFIKHHGCYKLRWSYIVSNYGNNCDQTQ